MPYHCHCMTQKPWTKPTGSSPICRQAAKSGTVNPEVNAPSAKRRPAASGRSGGVAAISCRAR